MLLSTFVSIITFCGCSFFLTGFSLGYILRGWQKTPKETEKKGGKNEL